MKASDVAVLKTIWSKRADGTWAIHDLKGLTLKPKDGHDPCYFAFEGDMDLMTSTPSGLSRSKWKAGSPARRSPNASDPHIPRRIEEGRAATHLRL